MKFRGKSIEELRIIKTEQVPVVDNLCFRIKMYLCVTTDPQIHPSRPMAWSRTQLKAQNSLTWIVKLGILFSCYYWSFYPKGCSVEESIPLMSNLLACWRTFSKFGLCRVPSSTQTQATGKVCKECFRKIHPNISFSVHGVPFFWR